MKIRYFSFATALLLVSFALGEDQSPRIITCGWNAPTIGQFARDVGSMPGDLPLTGCVMTLHVDSGNPDPLSSAHSTDDWSRLDVDRSINAIAGVSKGTMTDNYLLLKSNPGQVDWLDDDGWKTIVDHYRIAARLARRAGLRGLLIDFEPYTEPHRQFQYSRQSGAIDHPFSDYKSAARRRGREVIQAIVSEFPDAEICTFFLLSYLVEDHHYRGPSPVGRSDADWCLAGHSYGLLPAFVDGWLDEAPPTIKIIDGCENGYWFKSAGNFFRCADGVRQRGVQLVSAENRQKYRNQIRVAFPIYLDAIHSDLAGQYTLEPDREDRLQLLRRNLTAAISAGDGLVWLYGEHGRWWPEAGDEALWKGKDVYPTWERLMPGVSEVVRSAAHDAIAKTNDDPVAGNKDKVTRAAEPSIAKPDSEDDKEIGATVLDVEPRWETDPGDGTDEVVLGAGQVTISGSTGGSGLATIRTEPNRRYMIQVQVIQQGRGLTKLSARWKTPDGKWASTKKYDVVAYPPAGDPLKPRTITAIVRSPPEPHSLVVICHASRQLTQDDAALFGNLQVGIVDQ